MKQVTILTKDFWRAAGIRALRTFIQVILAVWTAGTLITDVNWKFVLTSAASAAIYSLLTSIIAGLPEEKLAKTLYDLDNDPVVPEAEIEEEDEDGATDEK